MPKLPLVPGQLIVVYVTLTGPRTQRTVKMALDTGATHTLIPFEVALGLELDPAASRRRMDIVTASGTLFAPVVRIPTLQLIGQTLQDVEVVCHDLPPNSPVAGLLGLDVLSHFNLRLAFLRRSLELTR